MIKLDGINYQDHLVVVVDELGERAFVGGPDALVDVGPGRGAHVADVLPPEGLDDVVELDGVGDVEAPEEHRAVAHQLLLEPRPVRHQSRHQRLRAALARPRRQQHQRYCLPVHHLLPLALPHIECAHFAHGRHL